MTTVAESRTSPWKLLGVEVERDMDIDGALGLIGCRDEVVEPRTLYIYNEEVGDNEVEVPTHHCIYSNVYGPISVATPSYSIIQRRDLLEIAYSIVGLDRDHARIATIGNIGERGNVFFAYIRFPELVIDPSGVADTIDRGLAVSTSFDGTLGTSIGYSNERIACTNQLTMAMGKVQQRISARHTRNAEDRIREAAVALGYAGAVEAEVVKRAEQMLRVPGDKALDTLRENFWPLDNDLPQATYTRRERARDLLTAVYHDDAGTCAPMVGENGWGAYNAFTEVQDHFRQVRGKGADKELTRAVGSVMPGKVMKDKIRASELILALN